MVLGGACCLPFVFFEGADASSLPLICRISPPTKSFATLVAQTPMITSFHTVYLSSMPTKKGHPDMHKCVNSLSVPVSVWLSRECCGELCVEIVMKAGTYLHVVAELSINGCHSPLGFELMYTSLEKNQACMGRLCLRAADSRRMESCHVTWIR